MTATNPTSAPLSPERWAEIHSERYTVRSLASADVALDDVLAELDRVRAENARLRAERAETNAALAERDVALKAAEKRIAELEPHEFEAEYQGESDAKRRLARCKRCSGTRFDSVHAKAEVR